MMIKQSLSQWISALFFIPALLLSGPVLAKNNEPSPEQVKEQQAFAIGTQAYVWGYPIAVAEKTRRALTSVAVAQKQKAPTNQFAKARTLYGPEYRGVQSPNNDTIYTVA